MQNFYRHDQANITIFEFTPFFKKIKKLTMSKQKIKTIFLNEQERKKKVFAHNYGQLTWCGERPFGDQASQYQKFKLSLKLL